MCFFCAMLVVRAPLKSQNFKKLEKTFFSSYIITGRWDNYMKIIYKLKPYEQILSNRLGVYPWWESRRMTGSRSGGRSGSRSTRRRMWSTPRTLTRPSADSGTWSKPPSYQTNQGRSYQGWEPGSSSLTMDQGSGSNPSQKRSWISSDPQKEKNIKQERIRKNLMLDLV